MMLGLGELVLLFLGGGLLLFGGRMPQLLGMFRSQLEEQAMERIKAEVDGLIRPEDEPDEPVDDEDRASVEG